MKFFAVIAFLASFLFAAVNINTASKDELMSLKGVGQAKADAIIAHRANTPFKSVEELKLVKGIGDKILSDNKDNITITDSAPDAIPEAPKTAK